MRSRPRGERQFVFAGMLQARQYLVYAYEPGKDLSTSLCTRTNFLEDAAEDINFLGEAEKIFPEKKIKNILSFESSCKMSKLSKVKPKTI